MLFFSRSRETRVFMYSCTNVCPCFAFYIRRIFVIVKLQIWKVKKIGKCFYPSNKFWNNENLKIVLPVFWLYHTEKQEHMKTWQSTSFSIHNLLLKYACMHMVTVGGKGGLNKQCKHYKRDAWQNKETEGVKRWKYQPYWTCRLQKCF